MSVKGGKFLDSDKFGGLSRHLLRESLLAATTTKSANFKGKQKNDDVGKKMADILAGRLQTRSVGRKSFDTPAENSKSLPSEVKAAHKSLDKKVASSKVGKADLKLKLDLEGKRTKALTDLPRQKGQIKEKTSSPKVNSVDERTQLKQKADLAAKRPQESGRINQSQSSITKGKSLGQTVKSYKDQPVNESILKSSGKHISKSQDKKGALMSHKRPLDSKTIMQRKEEWKLPMGPTKQPPGVYFDENLLRTPATYPIDRNECLLAAGPFGIGEAKACLDDLQATLLSYYNKLYRIDPDVSIDWQLDQLSRSYYPSPYPISGNADVNLMGPLPQGIDLSKCAGNIVPPSGTDKDLVVPTRNFLATQNMLGNVRFVEGTPPDQRDKNKAVRQNLNKTVHQDAPTGTLTDRHSTTGEKTSFIKEKRQEAQTVPAAHGETYEREPVTQFEGIINDLYDMSTQNSDRVDRLIREVNREVGDPTSLSYYRGGRGLNGGRGMPRGLHRPTYYSKRTHFNELEDHVETLQRNLSIRAQWNQKKIRLLEDRLQLMKTAGTRAGEDPRSAF